MRRVGGARRCWIFGREESCTGTGTGTCTTERARWVLLRRTRARARARTRSRARTPGLRSTWHETWFISVRGWLTPREQERTMGAVLSVGSINLDLQVRAERFPSESETVLGEAFLR